MPRPLLFFRGFLPFFSFAGLLLKERGRQKKKRRRQNPISNKKPIFSYHITTHFPLFKFFPSFSSSFFFLLLLQYPEGQEEMPVNHIRITLTSKNVQAVEKVCADLKSKAQSRKLKVTGPVRMPTKILKLCVRKSPCGEGTNTFDRWQMRIHKRVLDLYCPPDIVKQITNIQIEAGVYAEVTIVEN